MMRKAKQYLSCLLILLLVGICKFSMLVRQVIAVHEARQNSEQAS